MNTVIQQFAIATAFLSSFFFAQIGMAQVSFTFDEAGFFGNPTLVLDDSHDLVRLTKDGDEVEIEIYMFDSAVFDGVPNTLDFDLLEDLASVYDKFDIDIEDVEESYFGGIVIGMAGGDDQLYTDPALDINIAVLAGEGDDFIQGGSGNDLLLGNQGSDVLFGFGGDDRLEGGNEEFEITDYERDYLWGGTGSDLFIQPYIETIPKAIRVVGLGLPGVTPTATRAAPRKVTLDRIMDFQSWQDEIEMYQIYN